MRDFERASSMSTPARPAPRRTSVGGWKQTGNGHREAGHVALDTFTEWKAVYIDYSGASSARRSTTSKRTGRGPPDLDDVAAASRATIPGTVGAADVAVWAVELRKTFNVPVREAGVRAATKSLVRRETREVQAVDGDQLRRSRRGEVVGFLGPNGAGKTTTLKMLSGLLYPTAGEARVLGYTPSKREAAFLRRITMVMGNRNQLQWDLPALDSFELIRAIYRLPRDEFRQTRDELIELLDLGAAGRQAGPQPVARRADEGRDRRRAAAPAAGPVPRRADDRPRRHDAEADPVVRRRVQPAARRDGPADQPLHGRRPGAVQAGRS